MTVEFREFWEF